MLWRKYYRDRTVNRFGVFVVQFIHEFDNSPWGLTNNVCTFNCRPGPYIVSQILNLFGQNLHQKSILGQQVVSEKGFKKSTLL